VAVWEIEIALNVYCTYPDRNPVAVVPPSVAVAIDAAAPPAAVVPAVVVARVHSTRCMPQFDAHGSVCVWQHFPHFHSSAADSTVLAMAVLVQGLVPHSR